MAQLAAPAGPRRVLEIGIGYGAMLTTLRELFPGVEVAAVEHPAREILSNHRFMERLERDRVQVAACDVVGDEIPFDDVFDVVLFCDVIEHLPPVLVPGVLAKLAAKVAPTGRLIMSSTNLAAFLRVASLAFGRGMIQDPAIPLDYAGGTLGHVRLYGRADIEILVDHVGLRLADWRYLNWERVFLDTDTIGRKLSYLGQTIAPRLLPHLSTSWACAAAR